MPSSAMQTVMPGEQHRAPGGVDRVDDRVLGVAPRMQPLAVAGDDEQRVVDADAEADQQRQLGAERRHRDHVREQPDHRDAGAEREARGDAAAAHRQQRAEHEEQDDAPRRGSRSRCRPRPGWLASSIAWPPSSTWTPSFAADWATEITRFAALSGSSFACFVEGDGGEGDPAVLGDLRRDAPGRTAT